MHLEDATGVRTDCGGVVGQVRAVGGADLPQPGAGGGDQVRQPEPVADLDHLAAADHHLATGGERRRGEDQGCGPVVRTDSAAGAAAAKAARVPRPRRARRPVARSNSTSVYPAAPSSASTAADESPARPRLVCSTTPVALITGRVLLSEAAVRTALPRRPRPGTAHRSGPLLGVGDRSLDDGHPETFHRGPHGRVGEDGVGPRHQPPRVDVSGHRLTLCGQVPGPFDRGCPKLVRSPPAHRLRAWRRRTGIEPRQAELLGFSGLKTGRATRHPYASVDRARSAPGRGCDDSDDQRPPADPVRPRWRLRRKIPPGELEEAVGTLVPWTSPDLLVGLESGDDAAVVRIEGGRAIVMTADFFTAVVDDAYGDGRIAAANALSDVYAMGAEPLVALNLVGWPRDVLPLELLTEVLRGGADVAREAQVHVAGGQSIDDPEPKYGMAVTGTADPDRLLPQRRRPGRTAAHPDQAARRRGAEQPAQGDGQVFPDAIESMVRLNRDASRAALAAGVAAATDVTGFGLLGHGYKLARASGVSLTIEAASVPYLEDARQAVRDGFVSGGTRRNLAWVESHLDADAATAEDLILLADAQTSGGLLVVGEVPGCGHREVTATTGPSVITVR